MEGGTLSDVAQMLSPSESRGCGPTSVTALAIIRRVGERVALPNVVLRRSLCESGGGVVMKPDNRCPLFGSRGHPAARCRDA